MVSSFRGVDDPGTYLLDPATGGYRKTSYSWAVASPDGRQAAVLPGIGPDGRLTASRIGVLDLRTEAVRWTATPVPIWAPTWSPDGKTLLAAAAPSEGFGSGPNTGFLRLDVSSGRVTDTPVADEPHPTGPFLWGPDEATVITSTDLGATDALAGRPGGPVVYDLAGRQLRHLDVPGNVLTLAPWSPSGRLLVLDGAATDGRPQQLIIDATTARVVARIGTPHPALGWRDDTHLLVRTDDGAVQSVDIASGGRRTVAMLPQRDVEDVFVSSAADLPHTGRSNAF